MPTYGALRFEIDDSEVRRMIDLGDQHYRGAAAWALNRSWRMLWTRTRRLIAKRLRVAQKHVNRRTRFFRANTRRLVAGVRMYVQDFNPAKLDGLSASPGAGVKWESYVWPKGFVAPGKGGKGKFVFVRIPGLDRDAPRKWGQPQLPVEVQKIDVEPVAEAAFAVTVPRYSREFFERVFPRELIRRLKRGAR